MSANDPKRTFPSPQLSGYTNIIPPARKTKSGMEMSKRCGGSTVSSSAGVRFEPCSRLGCLSVTSSCSRFSCSPLSYGAGGHPFWPSLHSWWVSPFGLDGNTHVQHGQPASSQEREARRSDPDARGNTTDIEYIYMRNRSDRGLELINDDSWWWLKRNSERVFNDAKTAQDRNTEMTVMWNWWCSTLFGGTPT